MHELADSLALIVGAAVTLAGFSGVVLVLGRRARGKWSALERARIFNLLATTFAALFFSLSALTLLHAGSHVSAETQVAPATESGRPSFGTVLVLGVFTTLVAGLQIVNVVWLCEFWPVLVALEATLGISCYVFARLLTVSNV